MAHGDGKATKGRTKGKMLGTKRMATGGFASSSREGGFAGAGAGRLESPGQRSSVSPGGGNISAGNTPGGGGGGGNGGLGSSNRDGGFGSREPTTRLANVNYDGSVSYSAVPGPRKDKQFYDRILPESPEPPATRFGPFSPKTGYVPKMEGTPINTTPARPAAGGFGPFNPSTGYTPKMEGTPVKTGWNAATGTFDGPKISPAGSTLPNRNFGPASPDRVGGGGGGRDGDGGGRRRKKKFHPGGGREGDGERGRMSNGGTVRGDGKSLTGKTKGRMV